MEAEANLERRWISPSPEATERFGRALGERLSAGDVVALDGELGSGKTTLVRGIARGLGVRDAVSSPSYALMHTYAGRLDVYHFDAWMERREQAFLEGGGAEWLGSDGVALVEWAGRVAEWLPSARVEIEIAHRPPDQAGEESQIRCLRIRGVGEAAAALVAGLPFEEA
jgi:tRNA threonylcarbamoyladenosine biosynthesis protein TsaE